VSAELVSLALSLVDVAARDPGEPLTHIVLAGLFGATRRLVASLDAAWEKAPEDERARWSRDLPLLSIAQNARSKRTAKAWDQLAL
jgi:hypothetical protein